MSITMSRMRLPARCGAADAPSPGCWRVERAADLGSKMWLGSLAELAGICANPRQTPRRTGAGLAFRAHRSRKRVEAAQRGFAGKSSGAALICIGRIGGSKRNGRPARPEEKENANA
jgi:hypothetical protein